MSAVTELLRFQGKVLMKVFSFASLAVLLFLGVGPRVAGYRTLTVLTGSMRPSYPPGSVVVVTQKPAEQLRVGDVLVYQAPIEDHRVVTHRVVDLTRDGATFVVQTKGDANSDPDPWLARMPAGSVWTARASIPALGSAIRAMRTPLVHKLLVVGIPFSIALMWIIELWKAPPARPREAHA